MRFFPFRQKNKVSVFPRVLSIQNHMKRIEGSCYHHTAIAQILNFDEKQTSLIASSVSEKAGFHPIGYGIYDQHTLITPTDNENEFRIQWRTSDNCD